MFKSTKFLSVQNSLNAAKGFVRVIFLLNKIRAFNQTFVFDSVVCMLELLSIVLWFFCKEILSQFLKQLFFILIFSFILLVIHWNFCFILKVLEEANLSTQSRIVSVNTFICSSELFDFGSFEKKMKQISFRKKSYF